MLDANNLATYKQLKSQKEAAYKVFKKNPTIANATRHTTAAQAFTNFCVETMATLANDIPKPDTNADILENINDYRTCKVCGAELIYLLDSNNYIASSDFVLEFPGWCHSCLVTHCVNTPCEECDLVKDYRTCTFKEVKKIYAEG
jgi:hypothetical protein